MYRDRSSSSSCSIFFLSVNSDAVVVGSPVVVDGYSQDGNTIYVRGKFEILYHESIELHIGNHTLNPNEVSSFSLEFDLQSLPTSGDDAIVSTTYLNCSVVFQQNTTSNLFNITVAPYLADVIGSPKTEGGIITLMGNFLLGPDPKHDQYNITIGTSFSCSNVKVIDNTQLECLASPGYGATQPVNLFLNNVETNSQLFLNYQKPTIETITKLNYNGGNVTIDGENFHPTMEIFFVFQKCKNLVVTDYKRAVCFVSKVPSKVQDPAYVMVTVGDQSFSTIYHFDDSGKGMAPDTIIYLTFGIILGVFIICAIIAIVYIYLSYRKTEQLYKDATHKYFSLESYDPNQSMIEEDEDNVFTIQ
ncbi:hypothetical protein PPL_05104 [Heterostelium album PN500]|uniref:IPT/TIG domain-containing protein n=1 Tax=Heterostelium pallidum (strain ATCC 26659 / Pp 5 / PN500) TaxID=670386 RepID=D3B9G0_HETP5|nr:hypothetical protein PPL_05104 [Heterostelium album PN500]EFA81872.1 hypothetical protein PPL_05104 [Heterostelium album PN500]|eukprot:XP_020433989.1 hypothetical protein PPL_05104 [Heterostelium album PN500]